MRLVRFIGDIHSRFNDYLPLLGDHPSIQVGDFGIGFRDNPTDYYDVTRHKFARGNHDDPAGCRLEPNWIPDGTTYEGVFVVGGAQSTDQHLRTEGKDWWPDEQLSHEQLWAIADTYEQLKPQVVVSHDAPEPITHYMKGYWDWNVTRTQQALTGLLSLHRPKVWLFGHYHKSYDETIDGCRFICLNINEYIDLDLDAIQE